MTNNSKLVDKLSGKENEKISNMAFKMMVVIMKLIDIFGRQSSNNFKTLELKPGQTIIDYGCGPARYILNASKVVGDSGKVIAVDIHPIAIEKVKAKINRYKLNNVEAVLAEGYSTPLGNDIADVVFALDMFHMIEKPKPFLTELNRLVKLDGEIIIEDGHQPRSETIEKIESSGILKIYQETRSHVKCKPIK